MGSAAPGEGRKEADGCAAKTVRNVELDQAGVGRKSGVCFKGCGRNSLRRIAGDLSAAYISGHPQSSGMK
jgi:hypothetical protein